MKIVVCIKQVPDTADISWTENNTMKREGMEAILNPFDEFALETAFKIKDKFQDTHITVITMGPPQAKEILKQAIAKGADEAILLSDKKFAGADTFSTSKTLAKAIKKLVPDFNLIICGQFATDGDTGQTGSAISTHLDIPCTTFVKEISEIKENCISILKQTETTLVSLNITLPALICIIKTDYALRPALINGYIKAHSLEIKTYSAEDIELNQEETGMKGSPTYVCKAFRPDVKRQCNILTLNTAEEAVLFLDKKIKELKERYSLNE